MIGLYKVRGRYLCPNRKWIGDIELEKLWKIFTLTVPIIVQCSADQPKQLRESNKTRRQQLNLRQQQRKVDEIQVPSHHALQ